ncbi:MAG: hypothetical protein H6525_06115 [Actinobacteria bacterium]|nr:hypothetical protein [Actinomycetota bacterium]MCB9412405.1 hypothetical protein [Actinomycetota bacterium]
MGAVGAVGKVVVDVVLTCERAPAPDEHQNVQRLVTAGGAAANVAAQLASRGHQAILAGWQGDDEASRDVCAALAARGVTLRTVARDRAPVATVLAWGGDRAFLVDQGTLRARLEDVTDSWLDGMSIVHFNGFELLDYCWPDVLAQVARLAHRRGIMVSVDCPTASRIVAQGAASFRRAVAQLQPDFVFANASEAATLDLLTGPLLGSTAVVVHSGTAPSACRTPQARTWVPLETVVPNPETTGCGDAFAAGFLHAWQQGESGVAATLVAHRWASEQARVTGAQPPLRQN